MERRDSGLKMFLRNFYSEGVPALVGISLMAPIERYLLLSQTRSLSNSPEIYNTFINYAKTVRSREGILGYWRGNFCHLMRYTMSTAIKFRTYHYFRNKFIKDTPTGSELVVKEGLALISSSLLCQLFTYPLELLRIRIGCDVGLKGQLRNYNSIYDCIQKIIPNNGVKGLYEGFTLTFGCSIGYIVTGYNIYELLRPYQLGDTLTFALSAYVAQSLFYPFEVLRRRRQVADGESYKLEPSYAYTQIAKIWSQEGLKGLYKGIVVSSFKLAPLIAIQYTIFNSLKKSE
jgi:Mitochondrial carrier protein